MHQYTEHPIKDIPNVPAIYIQHNKTTPFSLVRRKVQPNLHRCNANLTTGHKKSFRLSCCKTSKRGTWMGDDLIQSVSWSGRGVYQSGYLPILLSNLVYGDSGINASSSSASSSCVFGIPSGTGNGLGFAVCPWEVDGTKLRDFSAIFFRKFERWWMLSIRYLTSPSESLTILEISSLGSSCCEELDESKWHTWFQISVDDGYLTCTSSLFSSK